MGVTIGLSLSIKVFEFEFPCVLILIKDFFLLPQLSHTSIWVLDIFSRCQKTENEKNVHQMHHLVTFTVNDWCYLSCSQYECCRQTSPACVVHLNMCCVAWASVHQEAPGGLIGWCWNHGWWRALGLQCWAVLFLQHMFHTPCQFRTNSAAVYGDGFHTVSPPPPLPILLLFVGGCFLRVRWGFGFQGGH